MVTPGSLLKFMTICYSILVNFNEKKRVEHRFGRKKVEIYLVQKLESGQWLLLLKITDGPNAASCQTCSPGLSGFF